MVGLGRSNKGGKVMFAGTIVESHIIRKIGRTGGLKRNAQELIRSSRGQTISLRQRKVGVKYVEPNMSDDETTSAETKTSSRQFRQYRDVPRARKAGIDWMDGITAKPYFLFSVRAENDTPLVAAQQLQVKVQQLLGINKQWYKEISTHIRFKQGTLLQIPDTPGAGHGTVPYSPTLHARLYGATVQDPDESDDEWGFVRPRVRAVVGLASSSDAVVFYSKGESLIMHRKALRQPSVASRPTQRWLRRLQRTGGVRLPTVSANEAEHVEDILNSMAQVSQHAKDMLPRPDWAWGGSVKRRGSKKACGLVTLRGTKKKQAMQVINVEWVQCEDPCCGKWLELPSQIQAASLPDNFFCKLANKWSPGYGALCGKGEGVLAATASTAQQIVSPLPKTAAPELEWVQCDGCDKWRVLPNKIKAASLPDSFYCAQNTWSEAKTRVLGCAAPEESVQQVMERLASSKAKYARAKAAKAAKLQAQQPQPQPLQLQLQLQQHQLTELPELQLANKRSHAEAVVPSSSAGSLSGGGKRWRQLEPGSLSTTTFES